MMGTNRWGMLAALAVMLASPVAHAATDSPMIVASAGQAVPQRFMSLASVRSGVAGVHMVKPMRSDRAMMNNGFMRMDRTKLAATPLQHSIRTMQAARVDASPVLVTKPQASPVLDLFGDDEKIPEAAPALTSFGRVSHAWPIASSITQRLTSMFGPRKDPFHGHSAFHGGVDIATAPGTSVLASADGVVSKVENGSRFGKYVSVKHRDGTESSYGHLSAQSVRVGQRVQQGQKLGEVGSTGRSTGPHLDYRISKNGALFNPMTVLHQPGAASTSRVASNIRNSSAIIIVR